MATRHNAASRIVTPCRILVVGPSRCGKTKFVVDLIKDKLAAEHHRIIGCSPTLNCQDTFDPIRKLIKPEDVHENFNTKTLQMVIEKIHCNYKRAKAIGTDPEKILMFIDDLAGNSCIHGKRQGPFAQFANQCNWWKVTLIVLTQQPTAVDPNFRDNAENIIVFRDKGMAAFDWVRQAYTALDQDKELIRRVMMTAWRGGRNDNSELGQHFLFIHAAPRGETEFFVDFDQKINVT